MNISRTAMIILLTLVSLFFIGFVIPEYPVIPVKEASSSDWNHNTFWHEPWGKSGVHKGIDIFGKTGTPVISPTPGIVVYRGQLQLGGNVVLIAGPKWRLHYLAHLEKINYDAGMFVGSGSQVGTLGSSGNALGKQPHLHYSIVSVIPYPWRMTGETQGWKKMFFLNPHKRLKDL